MTQQPVTTIDSTSDEFVTLSEPSACPNSLTSPHAGWQPAYPVDWFSSSVVHDLRNPLGTIYAGAEMLMDFDPAPTQVKRLAANIHRAAARIRDLLADLTSPSHGSRFATEVCNLRELTLAASDAAATVENQHVQISIDVPGDLELPLARSRIERVLFNLITNSFEAMPAGGKIWIRAAIAGNCALIEVEDSGPGIPLAIRDRLFEPFVTHGKENGMGLGLALSRNTVLQHGGDMWTEPAPGARFLIRLPL